MKWGFKKLPLTSFVQDPVMRSLAFANDRADSSRNKEGIKKDEIHTVPELNFQFVTEKTKCCIKQKACSVTHFSYTGPEIILCNRFGDICYCCS